MLLDRIVHHALEVWGLPVPPSEPDERETGRKQTAIRQVVDGGHELLTRQVARDPEDDQPAGARDAVQAAIGGKPEWIGLGGDVDRRHASPRDGQPSARRSAATAVDGSARVRLSTGRPCAASTLASPAAWAAMS